MNKKILTICIVLLLTVLLFPLKELFALTSDYYYDYGDSIPTSRIDVYWTNVKDGVPQLLTGSGDYQESGNVRSSGKSRFGGMFSPSNTHSLFGGSGSGGVNTDLDLDENEEWGFLLGAYNDECDWFSFSGLVLTIDDEVVTLQQGVDKGYIKPLILYASGVQDTSFSGLLNGGTFGGYFDGYIGHGEGISALFMTNSGHKVSHISFSYSGTEYTNGYYWNLDDGRVTRSSNRHEYIYNISYDLNEGYEDTPNPTTYKKSDPTIELFNPVREGYDFLGWEPEGIIPAGSTGDKEFKALWERSLYTIKFVDFNNNELKTENVYYGDPATAPDNYEVEGYDFMGWDPSDFSFIKGNLTIHGLYHVKTYPVTITTNHNRDVLIQKSLEHFNTITYQDMEGNDISSLTISEMYKNNIEPDTIYGYTFKSYSVTNDGHGNYFIKPLYQPKRYKVTFFDSNERLLDTQFIEYLNDADPPTPPRIHGYTFSGWDKPYLNIIEDTELYALYNNDESVPRWSVTFAVDKDDTDYGYFNIENEIKYSYTNSTVIDTTKIDTILPTYTTSKNCKFVGWYVDGEKINPSSYKVTNITNVTAKFMSDVNYNNIDDDTEEVVINFDSMGGSEIESKIVTLNHRLDSLDSPTKEGSEFLGWYLSSACVTAFDFSSRITKDMTLYAKWSNSNEVVNQPKTKVIKNEIVEEPAVEVLIPDYRNIPCEILFINGNDNSTFVVGTKYGIRFYIYNLKNQKIREYQVRQNSTITLPKITVDEDTIVEWKLEWNEDDIAYHLSPITKNLLNE